MSSHGRHMPLEAIAECGYVEQRVDLRETKLYGRSREVEILRDAFRRVVCRGKSELILVSGPSGSGKTKLVEEGLRQYVAEEHGGFFVAGKYDSLQIEPYSALVCALTDLVGQILESGDAEETMIEIDRNFSDCEIEELTHLIPSLARLSGRLEVKPRNTMCMAQAFTRFRLLCRSLIRILATPTHPVVLFVDDIQWIDDDSQAVLKTLIADSMSRNLLLVCTTRELTHFSVTTIPSESSIPVSALTIGDMTLGDIAALVSDVFQIDDTQPLSKIVLSKTSGNMLHISQFLDMLQTEGLLAPSFEGWKYSVEEIQENTTISESALELLELKIQRLHSGIHDVLKVASCLGRRFQFDLLVHICRSQTDEPWNDTMRRVNGVLDTAIHLGYLEQSKHSYAFVHDRVHQCWYNMIKEGHDQRAMHLEVGRVIRSQMLIEKDSSLLFLAADNLRRGLRNADGPKIVQQTLELLLEASQKAMRQCAFVQANSYAWASMRLLREDTLHWKKEYNLSVKLYCTRVEIEKTLGNFEKARLLAEEVLTNSDSFDDSVRAHLLIIESLGSEGKSKEALKHGFKVLRMLGEDIPSSNMLVHFIKEIIATKRALRYMTDEDYLSLPLMRNKLKLAAMQILSSLAAYTYLSIKFNSDGQFFCLLSLRMMRLSVKYGLCDASCHGFACYGIFESVAGSSDEAIRYGLLTMKLIEKLGAKRMEPKVVYVLQGRIMHCKQPWTECREAMQRMYPKALEMGDLDSAFHLAAYGLVWTATLSEAPLSLVEQEISGYCKLMKEYGQDALYNMTVAAWQRCQNYMGDVEDVLTLTGSVMDEEIIVSALESDGNITGLTAIYIQKLGLALFFECWDTVGTLIPKVEKHSASHKSHISQYYFHFLLAASYAALHRVVRRRKYRRGVARATSKLREWKNSGVKDCAPMLKFLEAERELTYGKNTAPDLFVEAAKGLSDSKWLLNFQALAHERAGSYYLAQDKHEPAVHHFSVAISKYEDWNAGAKVQALRRSLKDRRLNGCEMFKELALNSNESTLLESTRHERFSFASNSSHLDASSARESFASQSSKSP